MKISNRTTTLSDVLRIPPHGRGGVMPKSVILIETDPRALRVPSGRRSLFTNMMTGRSTEAIVRRPCISTVSGLSLMSGRLSKVAMMKLSAGGSGAFMALYRFASMWRSPHLSILTGTLTRTPRTGRPAEAGRPGSAGPVSILASMEVALQVQSLMFELPSSHNRLSARTSTLFAVARIGARTWSEDCPVIWTGTTVNRQANNKRKWRMTHNAQSYRPDLSGESLGRRGRNAGNRRRSQISAARNGVSCD